MSHHHLNVGDQARIKHTGQLVEVKRVSEHGIAEVAFRTGGKYVLLNDRLEPVKELH